MEITAILPKQAASTETPTKAPESGFDAVLSGAQGPPGPEPPPAEATAVKEAATPEPNAQSTKPNLSSKKTDPTTLSADQLMLLASQMPLVTPQIRDITGLNVPPTVTDPSVVAASTSVTATTATPVAEVIDATPSAQTTLPTQAVVQSGTATADDKRPAEKGKSNVAPTQELPSDDAVKVKSVEKTVEKSAPVAEQLVAPVVPKPASNSKEDLSVKAVVSAVTTDAAKGELDQEGFSEKQDKKSDDPEPTQIAQPLKAVTTAPTEKAVPATQISTSERTQVVRQVADRIELMAATRPKEGVTIHLQPDNLGTVTLVVKSLNSTVETQIYASNDHVRDALNQSRNQLVAAMHAKGITLSDVSVSGQSDFTATTGQKDPNAAQQQMQQQQSSTQRPTNTFSGGGAALNIEQMRRSNGTGPGVDVWI